MRKLNEDGEQKLAATARLTGRYGFAFPVLAKDDPSP